MLYEDEMILNSTRKRCIRIIVEMLKGDKHKLDDALIHLNSLFSDVKRETLEEELFKNGISRGEAEFIVGNLASEWCKNYIMLYGFSKDVMIELQKTDHYKYIMK